ncbi:MAG: glycosyltransferase [Acidobacteria bacterium]|nr:glycosyltransferase [Acidobacteriota bacterium]
MPAGSLLALLAFALLGLAAYAYLGYPLVARLLVPRLPPPPAGAGGTGDGPGALPAVSVLVAARNEAPAIGARLANLLSQDYPSDKLEILVASDASDDGTDAIVAAAGDPRVRLWRQEPRAGKTAAINQLGRMATGEILVQTDADVTFAPGALRALAAAFDDPRVGVADGTVRFSNAESPEVAGGEGLYWRFENWTKEVESGRGLLCVANGGIYALRRALWRPLPVTVAGDAAEPLLAAREGYLTVVAPGARAQVRAAATLAEEFQRKVRIIAQQVACARWIGLSTLPLRTLWAYASHKLLRYAVPVLAGLALATGAGAAALGSRAGLAAVVAVLLPVAAAPLGLLRRPRVLARLFRVPLYLVMINAAAAAGLARGLSGRAAASWEAPASTRRAP